MVRWFRSSFLRSNLVEVAFAVALGVALGSLVAAFVANLIVPLIAAVGKRDISTLFFTTNGEKFPYGAFLIAAIQFLIIAVAGYFIVIARRNDVAD